MTTDGRRVATRALARAAARAMRLAVVGAIWCALGDAAGAATFTVTTTADTNDGTCDASHCSLREALTAAQANVGADTINFNIPGSGVRTINLSNCLPGTTQVLTIDGYTQPGSSPNTNATGAINAVPLIELRGEPSCIVGLSAVFSTANLTVRGLIINGFSGDQVRSTGASLVTVEGCFIGTNPDGMSARVTDVDNSGNGIGGADGSLVVGGTTAASRNLISGLRWAISHGNSGTSVVRGNLIGTNKLGTAALPNGHAYISLLYFNAPQGTVTAQIGGATTGAGNVISGNIWQAIYIGNGTLATNSFVKGNYIGTDVTGTQPLANGAGGHHAVVINGGPNVTVGGTAPGEGNLIAFNTRAGVMVDQSAGAATDGTRILGNRIHSNGELGIDLQVGNTGVTPNDAGDADLRLQNFPVITGVSSSGGSTTIQGTLNSQASRTYRVELFASDAADAASHGEGQILLGSTNVTTNGSGTGTFSVSLPVTVTPLQYVTATATDPDGNTSEFSQIDADLSLTHSDTPDPAGTNQDVTYTFTVTNTGTVFPSGTVTLAYTRFASSTLVNGGGGTTVGAVTTFTIDPLAPGASAQRSVVVRYAVAGTKNSSATVSSTVIDPVAGNNTTAPSTTVTATPPPVSISGTVRTGINTALAGATLTLSGSASATTTSAANGTYSFTNLPSGGTFTVTPSIAGRVFEPVSRTLSSVTANQANVDFVGRLVYTISGQVRDLNDTGVPGVTMTLSGSQSATLTTDLEGRYAFGGLVAGGTYTVTPSKATFVFTPPSQTFPNLARDEVASFFIAEVGTFTRYFAEGATSDFFDTRIALFNATGQPASATVRFQRPAPQPEVTTTVDLDGLARVTIDPKTLGLATAEFSTVIESTQPLIADRTMTWDSSGYGSHAETSIGRPLTQWFLAEGATIDGFDLFYLVQNPGDTTATVEVKYLLPSPQPPIVKTYDVAPRSRFNIWVNTEDPVLDDAELSASITVTNGVPVIVERAMYRPVGGQVFGAGHESAGVEAPTLRWYFAEGATGPYFDLFYLVANPNDQAAELEATYLKPDGSVVTRTYNVAGNSRFNIWVDYEGAELEDTAVGTTFRVTNGVPVVIERAMWWDAVPGVGWQEGHDTVGATATGEKWGLAEGEVGGDRGMATYILVANTSQEAGTVRVSLTFEDGSPQATRDFPVSASSRLNVDVGAEFPEAAGKRFGALVESVGTTPVQLVVERAMYNDIPGVGWAAGTSAMGTRLR